MTMAHQMMAVPKAIKMETVQQLQTQRLMIPMIKIFLD